MVEAHFIIVMGVFLYCGYHLTFADLPLHDRL